MAKEFNLSENEIFVFESEQKEGEIAYKQEDVKEFIKWMLDSGDLALSEEQEELIKDRVGEALT